MASKYRNRKTVLDNITFHSQAEAVRYSELKFLQDAGHIRHLELQPKIELQPAFRHNGKYYAAIRYIGDFQYVDVATGEIVVEDVKSKGTRTTAYSLKKRLLLHKFPKLDFREVEA